MKKIFPLSLFFMLMLSISIFAVTKTLKSGGGSFLNWNSNGSWIPSGVPTASDDVVLAATSNNLTIDANAICASFTIDASYSGTIAYSGAYSLTVNGNWTNNGAPTLGSGSVLIGGNFTNSDASLDVTTTVFTFNGSGDQTINSASTPLPATTTFGDLVIDKTSGTIQLLSDVAVENTFAEINGTLDLNGNTLWVNGSPLPVELTSFSAVILDNIIKLNWRTETEVNNYGFEIQRSVQKDKWEVIGFIEGNGNSNSAKEYSYTDADVNSLGIYYYRLKQIDNDGAYEFSNQVEVNFETPNRLELNQNYPNPFNPSTTISFNLPESGTITLKIYNIMGEEIKSLVEGYTEAGIHTFNFNAEGYPSGMYLYSLSTNGFAETKKMLFLK
jgi:hypothetical protein